MAVLKSLGIKNLRSLKNIESVPISPITVLIGKNSVGKSTFARIFPLIRQSVERKKRSPILWFGDYVDFGSLNKALSHGEKEVSFKFSLSLNDEDINYSKIDRRMAWLKDSVEHNQVVKLQDVDISITISKRNDGQTGYAKQLSISSEDFFFSIRFADPDFPGEKISVSINGKEFPLPLGYYIHQAQGDILPNIYFSRVEDKEIDGTVRKVQVIARNPWADNFPNSIRWILHGNVSWSTLRKIAAQIPLGSVEKIAEAIKGIDGPTSWHDMKPYVVNLKNDSCKSIQTRLIAGLIPEIIDQVDSGLKKYFSSVRYLKPLRATAERYYRKQELAIHEIDAEGRNLAVFLDSLPSYALLNFRAWMEDNLKISVKASREGEQIMIMAKGVNDREFYNITDMGFGISQVLPIAAQLWAMNYGLTDVGKSSAIVIEQPELHLHPEFQARMADVFAASIKGVRKGQEPASLIIETHSQHIVNRLGALVERGVLSPSDVTILLFEPSEESESSTNIRISFFDHEGTLVNWPFGFFEPGDVDVD